MTERAAAAAQNVAGSSVEIVGATSEYGPPSIEGHYDGVFSIPPMLEIIAANRGDIDGIIVACFDDTGVDAIRSFVDVPVIGLCQAAMQTASVLAGNFSVITTLGRSVPIIEKLAHHYGYADLCRRVRASEIPVLDLEREPQQSEHKIELEIQAALNEDKAEAIVLGCAGMIDLANRLSQKFEVPVIEGVAPAVKIVEGLAQLGLKTTNLGGYAPPRAKNYVGVFSKHSP